jgi:8-amino-7-oxononanoate synthase
VIDWLMQRARPYIFTTASSPMMAGGAARQSGPDRAGDDRRAHLQLLIARLQAGLANLPWRLLPSQTAIQPLLIGDNDAAVQLSECLFEARVVGAGHSAAHRTGGDSALADFSLGRA